MAHRMLDELRADVVRVGRLMYEKNLAVAADGNISLKVSENELLTTPSGLCKGLLTEDDLVVTDREGNLRHGSGKPSSELRLHRAIYDARPDVGAVIHAHPPFATAFTIAGVSMAAPVLPEVVFTLGSIVTSRYATPASGQGPEVIRELIESHDAILLDHHGAVTCGVDIWDAYKKMEKVEHAAQTLLWARLLGKVQQLPAAEVALLAEVRSQLNLPGKFTLPQIDDEAALAPAGGAADGERQGPTRLSQDDVERIAEAVARRLADNG